MNDGSVMVKEGSRRLGDMRWLKCKRLLVGQQFIQLKSVRFPFANFHFFTYAFTWMWSLKHWISMSLSWFTIGKRTIVLFVVSFKIIVLKLAKIYILLKQSQTETTEIIFYRNLEKDSVAFLSTSYGICSEYK